MKKILFMACVMLWLKIPDSSGSVIRVPGHCEYLQEAIDFSENWDIILVGPGTYTGESNKNLNFHGKAVIFESEHGPESCIIDCEGSGRGFIFNSRETSDTVIDGFTVKNGDAGDDSGGCVYCYWADPIIRNCHFIQSYAFDGGGICYKSVENGRLENCLISGNEANSSGGGIFSEHRSCLWKIARLSQISQGLAEVSVPIPEFSDSGTALSQITYQTAREACSVSSPTCSFSIAFSPVMWPWKTAAPSLAITVLRKSSTACLQETTHTREARFILMILPIPY